MEKRAWGGGELEKTNIGSLSDVKGGKRVPKGMSLTADDTGHPYIKAGNLKLGTVLDREFCLFLMTFYTILRIIL